MKGIAHFVTGLAVASFFPDVVQGAALSPGFGPLLGGLAGLLPDTLDFKLLRYLHRQDEEIDPAGHPDPQALAERIAAAMDRAYDGGRQVTIQLHTLRLGSDLWRRYALAFDLAHNQVVVDIGPTVTTSQVPYAGSEIPGLQPGRALVVARIVPPYDAEIEVDAFSGPSLAFRRAGDGVEVIFLPWHRAWTHSLLTALLLGLAGFLWAPVYGLVMALAALAHTVQDQMGFMGSNLFFPASRKRVPGLRWFRSGDALPNFLTVWLGLAVLLLNLDRFSATPAIPVLPYLLGAIVAPVLLALGVSAWARGRVRRGPAGTRPGVAPAELAAVEALDEASEVDISA